MNVKIEMTASEALVAIEQNLLPPLLKTLAQGIEPDASTERLPVPEVPAAVAVPTATPAPAVTPVDPVVPMTTPVAEPAHVPTTAHQYSADEISKAAVQLMDAGKQAELLELLKQFGVNSVVELKAEQYGQFATELRQRGAQI